MVLPIKQKNNLAKLLIKYSDVEIHIFFHKKHNLNNQLSNFYLKNPGQKNMLLQNIIDRHIVFRDALIDPLNPINTTIIIDHQKYFWNPNIVENGQIRGPQTHYSHQMYSDFGFNNNGIQFSGLTGVVFGSLYSTTKPVVNVISPTSVSIASPHSFRQGLEYHSARMISSVRKKEVYLTDDDSTNLPVHTIMYNDMPKTQVIGDLAITHDKKQGIFSQTDVKQQFIKVAMKNMEPRVVCTGTTDPVEEINNIRNLAHLAISGHVVVHHVDPAKNTLVEKYKILSKVRQTGLIEDANELTGFPNILSNRHNDS